MHNPLDQFLIKPLFNIHLFGADISFTNSSLVMIVIAISLSLSMIIVAKNLNVVPNKSQLVFEKIYSLVNKMLLDNAGPKAIKFFPLVFTTFLFILSCNIFGMLPFSFTVTSHVSVTLALATFLFTLITLTGFIKHGWNFFSLFLPSGTPLWLAPLMILIELAAYLTKPFSLALRLAANMTAGHVLLKVVASFAVSMGVLFKVFPIAFITVLIGFELCISILQSYIFAILTCVYISDAINLH